KFRRLHNFCGHQALGKSAHASKILDVSRTERNRARPTSKRKEWPVSRLSFSLLFSGSSVLLTLEIFEACADFLRPDGLGSCRKRRDFGARRLLVRDAVAA